MTQEELDALIAGNLDSQSQEESTNNDTEHQDMAKQLGDVTKESEVKATEILTKLEIIIDTIKDIRNDSSNLSSDLDTIDNIIMDIMATMQYHDIHRQKIERVINNMRSISKLMNQTLHIVDEDIAPSAKHIAGDDTSDLVSEDELEALIASMNQK